jgi:adenylate cyclase
MLHETKGIIVQCNVGLNVGPVALGAMGRGLNTAVGEAVNLTFRIEGLTRQLGVPVLVGSGFVHQMPGASGVFDAKGPHLVKGQPDPIDVYGLREL